MWLYTIKYKLRYNEEIDEFICPENQRLKFLYESYEKKGRGYAEFTRELNVKNVNLVEIVQNCS
jgi:transposase